MKNVYGCESRVSASEGVAKRLERAEVTPCRAHPSLFHTLAILALGALVANGYLIVFWLWSR